MVPLQSENQMCHHPQEVVSTPSSATDEYKDTKKLLQSLLRGAADVEAQRKRLEDWFDNSMDRISGWYKRKSHAFLWIIGGALCLLVNADTISLSKAFWNDQALRAATVTAATEHLKNAPNERRTTQSANSTTQPSSGGTAAGTSNNTAFKRLNDVRAELSKVNIPLGWCWNGNEGELKKECFPIFNDSVRVTAKGKSGTKTYAYWIVSNYADGKSSLAGPFTLDSAPNKLNTENRVVITWPAEGDAKSYDVLRSLTSKRPEGKCNCAVATAVSGLTVEDKSESLHPYQFATWMEEQTPAKPQISVAGKSGAKTYYYWIATNTESGEIDLDGPYPAPNSPDTLSNNNYVVLTWQAVKGAKSYDVLRTSDTKLPTANCTCAVVTAVSKTEISDKSVTLQPYQLTVARAQDAALPDPRLIISGATCPETLAWVWWKLVGLALTALAISQGAPFWFDLLQKAVNLRLAGVAPDEKKEKQ